MKVPRAPSKQTAGLTNHNNQCCSYYFRQQSNLEINLIWNLLTSESKNTHIPGMIIIDIRRMMANTVFTMCSVSGFNSPTEVIMTEYVNPYKIRSTSAIPVTKRRQKKFLVFSDVLDFFWSFKPPCLFPSRTVMVLVLLLGLELLANDDAVLECSSPCWYNS